MIEQRNQRVIETLNRRQPDLTIVMENVHKPHNLSAIARTCDAVGVGQMHAVVPEGSLRIGGKAAGGTEKWVEVTYWKDVVDVVRELRSRGFAIYAADLDPRAVDFRRIDYTRPSAVLVGAELDGISDAALTEVDEAMRIPMLGMVESLNVSVASAVVLYEAGRQRQDAGMYGKRRISDEQFARLRFEWLHPGVAAHCLRHGLEFPRLDADGHIIEPISGNPRDGFGAVNS